MAWIGLQSLGLLLNETDDLALSYTVKAQRSMPELIWAMVSDEIKMYLSQGEAGVGAYLLRKAKTALERNPKLAYTVPKEGSNIWFDNMVILRQRNVEGAYALINFLYAPDVAARNAEYWLCNSHQHSQMEQLPEEVTARQRFHPDDGTHCPLRSL